MRAKAIFSRAVIAFISLWLVFGPSLPLSEAQAEAGRITGDASLSSQASFDMVKDPLDRRRKMSQPLKQTK